MAKRAGFLGGAELVKASMVQYSAAGSCLQFTVWPRRKQDTADQFRAFNGYGSIGISRHLLKGGLQSTREVKSIYNTARVVLAAPFLNVNVVGGHLWAPPRIANREIV